jgi:hypothetical protein
MRDARKRLYQEFAAACRIHYVPRNPNADPTLHGINAPELDQPFQ